MAVETDSTAPLWSDPSLDAGSRADALIAEMTLQEKIAQLYGVWVGASDEGGEVAPHQHDMEEAVDLDELLPYGLGQLTRPFGTAPVDPAVGALSLARTQRRIARANRFGIPALAHEECLAGFATWGATAYPVPLSWGATFNPGLIREMAVAIGRDMRSVGIHQGLAPVLDVVRDARWGRVEETIGEDPYLVGTVATAYVQGLESAGIVATLKHFAGYSASRAGRNLAPVGMGARERADVILPPFEMAVREGGVRSVMHAYTDTDGIPSAADERLLTGLLRDTWGFTGTVVADYFGIAFLKTLHGVAGTFGEAAGAALAAGVDVELPTVKTFGEPLLEAVAEGRVPEALVDRAVRRVLVQKAELGLLDRDWSAAPPALAGAGPDNDADPDAGTDAARCAWTPTTTGPSPAGSPNRPSYSSATTAPCRCPRPRTRAERTAGEDRAHRPQRGGADGRAGLLRLPGPRRRPAPRGPGRHRTAHAARGVGGGVSRQRDRRRSGRERGRHRHHRVRGGRRTRPGRRRRDRGPR